MKHDRLYLTVCLTQSVLSGKRIRDLHTSVHDTTKHGRPGPECAPRVSAMRTDTILIKDSVGHADTVTAERKVCH